MLMRAVVLAMGCGVLMSGCGMEPARDRAAETHEIIENLIAAGFPDDDIMIVEDLVYVGRDAQVTLEASREMLDTQGSTEEQYRTTNLVGPAVTLICVTGVYNGVFGTAMNMAITNYNNLALRLRFARGQGPGCNGLINGIVDPNLLGGSSGFPSGGLPFRDIRIGGQLATFDINTIEHVITHEIGHAIGLRHSDFFNRSISCGGAATNEGSGGVGAILVPGTPNGATVGGSIMNSCFRTVETGEFTGSDVTALNAIY
jgi:Dual-action HEIGH metallo-peptidase